MMEKYISIGSNKKIEYAKLDFKGNGSLIHVNLFSIYLLVKALQLIDAESKSVDDVTFLHQ